MPPRSSKIRTLLHFCSDFISFQAVVSSAGAALLVVSALATLARCDDNGGGGSNVSKKDWPSSSAAAQENDGGDDGSSGWGSKKRLRFVRVPIRAAVKAQLRRMRQLRHLEEEDEEELVRSVRSPPPPTPEQEDGEGLGHGVQSLQEEDNNNSNDSNPYRYPSLCFYYALQGIRPDFCQEDGVAFDSAADTGEYSPEERTRTAAEEEDEVPGVAELCARLVVRGHLPDFCRYKVRTAAEKRSDDDAMEDAAPVDVVPQLREGE